MSVDYLCTLLFVANASDTLALLMGDALVRTTPLSCNYCRCQGYRTKPKLEPSPTPPLVLNPPPPPAAARRRPPRVHSWWSGRAGWSHSRGVGGYS